MVWLTLDTRIGENSRRWDGGKGRMWMWWKGEWWKGAAVKRAVLWFRVRHGRQIFLVV